MTFMSEKERRLTISMRNLALIVILLFALRITISRCQTTYSAISCAMGRKAITPRDQDVAAKLLKLMYPNGLRSAEGYVFFYLHTRENPKGQIIFLNNIEVLQESSFNINRPTKIVTHGYLSTKSSPACELPRDAFLSTGDYNVIVIDWYNMQSIAGIFPLDYWTVSGYVGEVGSYVAAMINFLENHGMNLETTTLIGHSLGAHVMGIAGYQARNKVNYIVGLDPALPAFESRNHTERLSIEDAVTVEVIHTNEGDCGMSQQIGHYDFYPNGGAKQPGCGSNTCSHSRVYELYSESIQSENEFLARRCLSFEAVKEGQCSGDVAVMGNMNIRKYHARNGMYYLETRDSSPYALGTKYLNI